MRLLDPLHAARRALDADAERDQPKQTVHSALKRLEADGLLKLAHGGNRKSKYVCLTDKGTRLAERTVDRIAEAEAEALLGLSDGEREALFSLLQKYNRLLRARLDAPDGSGTATGKI